MSRYDTDVANSTTVSSRRKPGSSFLGCLPARCWRSEVSLLGFDDNFHARRLTPALTTLRQPINEAGQLAAKLLLQLLAGQRLVETEITVPTELVVRDSVVRARPM